MSQLERMIAEAIETYSSKKVHHSVIKCQGEECNRTTCDDVCYYIIRNRDYRKELKKVFDTQTL